MTDKWFVFIAFVFSFLFSSYVVPDSISNKLNSIECYREKITYLKQLSEHYKFKRWDVSLLYVQQAHQIAVDRNELFLQADLNLEISYLYYELGYYEEALRTSLLSYDQYVALNDPKGIASALHEIGTMYDILGDHEKALTSLVQSLQIRLDLAIPDKIWVSYLNLGVYYYYQADYDKALEYYNKAYDIEINERVLVNMGEIYHIMGQYHKALEYLNESLRLARETKPDGYIEALALMNIGIVHFKMDDYEKAIDNLNSSIEIATKVSTKLLLRDIYSALVDVYSETYDFETALEKYKLFSAIKDSLFREKQIHEIAAMKARFETEQKEKMIEIQKMTIKKTSFRSMLFMSGAVLFAITILFLLHTLSLKHKTKKTLENINTELRASNATKDKFFSIISHDLRSTITGFRNLTSALLMNIDKLPFNVVKESIVNLNQSAIENATLLSNLLQWARLHKHKTKVIAIQLNVKYVCSSVVDELKARCTEKNIMVQCEIDNNLQAKFDEDIVSTILRNLLTNAIKFSPNGALIKLSALEKLNCLQITVKDNGIGMTEADLAKLFRIDCNTKSIGNSSEKGSGLGLLICKELVDLLGGTINVESSPGAGTSFSFSVPQ